MTQVLPPRNVPCLGLIDGIYDQIQGRIFVMIQPALPGAISSKKKPAIGPLLIVNFGISESYKLGLLILFGRARFESQRPSNSLSHVVLLGREGDAIRETDRMTQHSYPNATHDVALIPPCEASS